eukprot:3980036-Prorocentrum_lima.AAC.1
MWSGQGKFNNDMLDGIHALARLGDALNGFEYTSVQLDNYYGKLPRMIIMGGVHRGTNITTIYSNRSNDK